MINRQAPPPENKNVTIHYAAKDLRGEDIAKIKIKNNDEFVLFFNSLQDKDDKKTVYIFTSDWHIDEDDPYNEFFNELLVESNIETIRIFSKKMYDYSDCNIFIQCYNSFEDAYQVALSLRECNYLCYNK